MYIDGFFVLRFRNGQEIYYYISFQTQIEAEAEACMVEIMATYDRLTYAVIARYGLRFQIYTNSQFPAVDTQDKKKAVVMIQLSDGELQPIEVYMVLDNMIEPNFEIDLNNADLIAYVDTLAEFAEFNGRSIDISQNVSGMISGFAV